MSRNGATHNAARCTRWISITNGRTFPASVLNYERKVWSDRKARPRGSYEGTRLKGPHAREDNANKRIIGAGDSKGSHLRMEKAEVVWRLKDMRVQSRFKLAPDEERAFVCDIEY